VSLDWQVLQSLIDASPDGVVVCDANEHRWPVVYVNRAFEQLCGYSGEELRGRNLSFLQQSENEQEGLSVLRGALSEGLPCRVTLRNYRKDGTAFVNEMQVMPIRNHDGRLTHFASFHRVGFANQPATLDEVPADPMLNTQRMLAYVRDDKMTGLLRRSYFEDLLRRDFALTQRETKPHTVFIFGIDQAAAYKEAFSETGAEQMFKRVARTIATCFRRSTDLCARWEESEIVVASMSVAPDQALKMAELVLSRVRDLAIHHPRSPGSRFVTVSAGVVSEVPAQRSTSAQFIARALVALRNARSAGLQRVSIGPSSSK
jgi:PAS domain S-box-containing protein/diguanylate cyclase (GGDEF)-like protein